MRAVAKTKILSPSKSRNYPSVPIVLLHASYPYTREAGYLASVYSNVYADIGEVFPQVSQGGQEAILRQVLELCPWSKILWSTDGHWLPETYLLAMVQGREALESVRLLDRECRAENGSLIRIPQPSRFCVVWCARAN